MEHKGLEPLNYKVIAQLWLPYQSS